MCHSFDFPPFSWHTIWSKMLYECLAGNFIIGRSCHKYNFCHDKHVFVASKRVSLPWQKFCHDKIMFVVTKLCLSQQKWYLWQLLPMIKFGSPYLDAAIAATRAALNITTTVPVCAVFPCVQKILWLPALGIFDMCTDVGTCYWMWELYKHLRECTDS